MVVTLDKSKDKVTLLDEITGEIDIALEKSYKSSLNIDQVVEQARPGFRPNKNASDTKSINFSKDKKVLMEFAHLMITKIETGKGEKRQVTEDYVKQLGLSDFKQLKVEVEKLTEGVTFF